MTNYRETKRTKINKLKMKNKERSETAIPNVSKKIVSGGKLRSRKNRLIFI